MNRKGVKRPLPCGFGAGTTPCVVSRPGDSSNNNNDDGYDDDNHNSSSNNNSNNDNNNNNNNSARNPETQSSIRRNRSTPGRHTQQHRRRRAPTPPDHKGSRGILQHRRHPRPECCGCRRRNAPSATLRLAGVVGIHVLGLMACPCRGFTPPALAAGGPAAGGPTALPSDWQRRGTAAGGEFGRRASIGGGGRDAAGSGPGASAARYGRRRDRSGCSGGDGGGGGGGGPGSTGCRATRLPSAEEGPPLGLLYDRALLKAGVSLGVDAAVSSSKNNGGNAQKGGGNAVSSGAKASSSGDSGGGTAAATATGARRDGEESVPAAAAAAAAAATVVEINSNSINSNSINNVAQNVTARWTSVVNGAATAAAALTGEQSAAAAAVAAAAAAADASAPAVPRKKWSGKGWLVSRAESEERRGPQQLGTGPAASSPPEKEVESRVETVNGFGAGTLGVESGLGGPSIGSDGRSVAVIAGAAANATGPAVATGLPMVDVEAAESARGVLANAPDRSAAAAGAVGVDLPSSAALGEAAVQPPGQGDPNTELELGGQGEKAADVCAAAREELTAYLLEAGATEDLVATATAALFAAEPRCTLTEGTWKRWRQNLDGLRSTGFKGAAYAQWRATVA